MPISTDMIVRIAHADIAMHMAFSNSLARWQREDDEQPDWEVFAGDCDAVQLGANEALILDGKCSNGLSAPGGGIIHIYGDLASRIDISGHYELVVTGDVLSNAIIQASGFCNIFVGGRFLGELQSSDSTKLWIESDFEGVIKTGTPSTEIFIGNDYKGAISPLDEGALLYLSVAGFASDMLLSAIMKHRYTQFNASIGRSDVAPGLYPVDGRPKKTPSGGNSYNRWCVLS